MRIADLPWLTAADFAYPDHAAIYATIAGLHADGELLPVSDSAIMRNLGPIQAALHGQVFAQVGDPNQIRLRDLLGAAPPSAASLHVLYARTVLELRALRTIRAMGAAMTQVDALPADDLHETMVATVGDLETRVAQASSRSVLDPLIAAAVDTRLPLPPAAPNPRLVERAERAVLAGVLNDPDGSLTDLLGRIQPDDLAHSAEHQNTWRAIQVVARRGEPVNVVTVALEAERLPSVHQPAMSIADMMALDPPSHDMTRQVNVIGRASLHHRFKQAGSGLVAAAQQPGQQVAQLLTTARRATKDLHEHATRVTEWHEPSAPGERPNDSAARQPHTPQNQGASRSR